MYKNKILVIFSIIVLIIVVLGGYLYTSTLQQLVFDNPENITEVKTEFWGDNYYGKSETFINPEWKTYQNDQYHFKFDYPILGQHKIKPTLSENDLRFELIPFNSSLRVSKVGKVDIDDYVRSNSWDETSFNKVTFKGIEAYEGVDGGMDSSYIIVFIKDDYLYKFSFTGIGTTIEELKSELNPEHKRILSTFEFIN
ncbi:MAG: hypothetical protein A2571_02480 [Candidatus Vogelbacteria bacterium RIFOXYD1_FULL_44_32]|uniref:PsbP C-terminal domain-containing protein n=1 Tax=Candidatus Vogelbacteria bacterium RIFOXYD1_FULL_44_32 TaxID=1802438 RepID=A0A1G2QF53_9BACT|nr:MAG: hypothetical protein A2571_02480 [Candidatus Vogelbacteria bacterium RIFOXYD1_FULL_44_32]